MHNQNVNPAASLLSWLCLPCSGTFTITVKRAGLASSWLHEHMAPRKALLFRGIQVDK
jgi:ferredoxin-NADP reductase